MTYQYIKHLIRDAISESDRKLLFVAISRRQSSQSTLRVAVLAHRARGCVCQVV